MIPAFHRILKNESEVANIKTTIIVPYKWREQKQAINDSNRSMFATTRVWDAFFKIDATILKQISEIEIKNI